MWALQHYVQQMLEYMLAHVLRAMGAVPMYRPVGLKIEDLTQDFPKASSIFNPTALLNSIPWH